MGRGLISGGGAESRYNLTYKVKRTDAEKKITALTARITALEDIDIPKYEAGLTTATNNFNTKLAELNAAIAAKETPDVLRQLAAEASMLRFAMDEAQNLLDSAKIRLISFIKEKATLEKWLADFNDEELEVWCADYNENLTDHVGTIEIPGERTEDIIIRPGGDAGDQAVYNPETDGQIAPSIGMTPSGSFYNLAILPGWQKWMPTYRLGVITDINYNNDTCDVTLWPAYSKQEDLSGNNFDVNQEILLTNVQIEYMDCHSAVFKINDHVVVQFSYSGPGELDYTPKVIGFKDHPRSCGLVFLIVSQTEYAVWRIKDKGKELESYSFSLKGHINGVFVYSSPNFIFPSTVKSNVKSNEHYYVIQSQYKGSWGIRYGVQYLVSSQSLLVGIRNSYQPSGWDPDSREQWDGSLLYTTHNTEDDHPRYHCSGRKPWQIDDDGSLIKNLELWTIDGSSCRIEYDKEDGHIEGDTINYAATNYIAVLSKDKFIGKDESDFQSWANYWNQSDPPIQYLAHPCTGFNTEYYQQESEAVSGFPYKFGDVELEWASAYVRTSNGVPWQVSTGCGASPDCIGGPTEYWKWRHYKYSKYNTTLALLDYDNINIDETFLIIYYHYFSGNEFERFLVATDNLSGVDYDSEWNFNGNTREYVLAYRRNDGGLSKVILAKLRSGTTLTKTNAWVTNSCGMITSFDVDEDWVVAFSGQRIVNVSCKASGSFLFYTYILQDYTGPVDEEHWDDTDDPPANFTFNKRILGVIHIESGKRTEHEVNDALLGDLYKDTFDEEKASAVGLHMG